MDAGVGSWSNGAVGDEPDDLEARLTAAAEALREQQIIAHRCEQLDRRLAETEARLAELQAEYVAERRDVERLEGVTLTRVLASLRGGREDQLAREQAEADAAALRVQDAEARIAALQHELDAGRARLEALAGAPAEYEAALNEKEQYLRASADPRRGRVLELADERGRLAGELHEVGEAMRAVAAAQESLLRVEDHLNSASGWSTYDTFFGGGMFSSAIKHSKLDEAAAAAAHADGCLVVLRSELADVGGAGVYAPELGVTDLTRFVDVWLDNVFTDWAVRDRIQDAKRNVATCLHFVGQVGARLNDRAARTQARLEAIASERQELLTRDPT